MNKMTPNTYPVFLRIYGVANMPLPRVEFTKLKTQPETLWNFL